MKSFSIRSLLVCTAAIAMLCGFVFMPFAFKYPVVARRQVSNGIERLVLVLNIGDGIVRAIEIDDFELTESKTGVTRTMTLLELIKFEWQNPIFELNPDRPTECEFD